MARFTIPRNMYIQGAIKVTKPGIEAEVYVNPVALRAVAFAGKSQNATWNYRFVSKKDMENRIKMFFQGCEQHEKYNAERKAQRREERAKGHSYQVGDILYTSWGYDQTNVEFYQVVEVPGPATVKIREIAADYVGDSSKTPVKDKFLSRAEVLTRRAVGNQSVKINKSANAYAWDGKPKHYSRDH